MSQTYKNPLDYLNDAVTKRGRSGPDGVYLTNVTVVAESSTDYGYKVSTDRITPLVPPANIPPEEWSWLLVSLRSDYRALDFVLNHGNMLSQLLVEGNQLSMNVFAPNIRVESFPYLILSSQEMLKCLADFSGKLPSTIRFNLGVVTKTWDEMVESGEAQEVELSF